MDGSLRKQYDIVSKVRPASGSVPAEAGTRGSSRRRDIDLGQQFSMGFVSTIKGMDGTRQRRKRREMSALDEVGSSQHRWEMHHLGRIGGTQQATMRKRASVMASNAPLRS